MTEESKKQIDFGGKPDDDWGTIETSDKQMNGASEWWYLSYADGEFRGAVILKADSFLHAACTAAMLQIAPGGQVVGHPISQSAITQVPDNLKNRLLSKEDLEAAGLI